MERSSAGSCIILCWVLAIDFQRMSQGGAQVSLLGGPGTGKPLSVKVSGDARLRLAIPLTCATNTHLEACRRLLMLLVLG